MTVFRLDNFVEAGDPFLKSGHTPDTGVAWVGNGTTVKIESSSSSAWQATAGVTSGLIGADNPTDADYFAEITAKIGGVATTDRVGVICRAEGSTTFEFNTHTYYLFRVTGSAVPNVPWTFWRCDDGVLTASGFTGTVSGTLPNVKSSDEIKLKMTVTGTGATVTIKLEYDENISGAGFSGYSTLSTITDTSVTVGHERITAAGNAGFYGRDVNFRISYFNAEDLISSGTVVNRVLTESTVVTDPVAGYVLSSRPGDRIQTLEDAVFIYTVFGRSAVDNLSASDAFVILQGLDRKLVDAVSLTDLLNILRSSFNKLIEAVSITDSIQRAIAIGKIKSEALILVDSMNKRIERVSLRQEQLLVSDSFRKTVDAGLSSQTFVKIIEDSLVLFDQPAPVKSGVIIRSKLDGVAVEELKAINRMRNRTFNDGAFVTDLNRTFRQRSKVSQNQSNLLATDSNAKVLGRNRSFSDSVGVSDDSDYIVTKVRSLFFGDDQEPANSISLIDDMIVSRASKTYGTIVQDVVDITDSYSFYTGTNLPISVFIETGIEAQ